MSQQQKTPKVAAEDLCGFKWSFDASYAFRFSTHLLETKIILLVIGLLFDITLLLLSYCNEQIAISRDLETVARYDYLYVQAK